MVDEVLYYQELLLIPEIIETKLISYHYNNLLAEYFDIDKNRKLIDRKYYWPSLKKDIEVYVKSYNIC